MDSREPMVSIIIPAWNEADILPECIDSLLASTYPNVEIIVVDNGSRDGTSDLLTLRFPQVRVLRTEENIGFGGALNHGTATARGEYLLWLNADASLEPTWIGTLVHAFQRNPRLGMASSVVAYRGGEDLVWSAGGYVDGLTGLTWDHGKGEPVATVAPPTDLDYVAGCAPMVRRSALEATGGLDADYFIYFEDADLGLRMKAAGYELAVLDGVLVRHGAMRRSGLRREAARKLFIFVRSNLRFVLKNWPAHRIPIALPACFAFYFGFALAKGLSSYLPSVVRAMEWNLDHLEETKSHRLRDGLDSIPRPRMRGLLSFMFQMTSRAELYPY